MPDNNAKNDNPKLHEVVPKERSGHNTIALYQTQFRAAAVEQEPFPCYPRAPMIHGNRAFPILPSQTHPSASCL